MLNGRRATRPEPAAHMPMGNSIRQVRLFVASAHLTGLRLTVSLVCTSPAVTFFRNRHASRLIRRQALRELHLWHNESVPITRYSATSRTLSRACGPGAIEAVLCFASSEPAPPRRNSRDWLRMGRFQMHTMFQPVLLTRSEVTAISIHLKPGTRGM